MLILKSFELVFPLWTHSQTITLIHDFSDDRISRHKLLVRSLAIKVVLESHFWCQFFPELSNNWCAKELVAHAFIVFQSDRSFEQMHSFIP